MGIIIPVKNGSQAIKKCLESIFSLDYKNFELIVIDDGSTDDTPRILSEYKTVRIITTKGIGPSAARNMGIKEAKAEFIAFTDGDCLVDKSWLKELLKGFVAQDIAAVGGSQSSPADDTEFGKDIQSFLEIVGFVAEYTKKGGCVKPTKHNPSCNAMYRRDVLLRAGGFLENFWPGEDLELDYRLIRGGHKLMFNPDAVVYHYRPATIGKYARMMYRYGFAQGYLVRRYGLFRTLHFEPFLLAFILILGMRGFGLLRDVFILSVFAAVVWFFARSLNIKKTAVFLELLFATLIHWNIGFIKGILTKEMK